MPQAMQLGLSSNMTWPMDAFVLCLKRSIYLFLAFANLVCLVTNHYVLNYHISKKLKLIGSQDQTEFNRATATTKYTMCRLFKIQNKMKFIYCIIHFHCHVVCKFYVLKLVLALISQCGLDSLLSGVYIIEFLTFKWEAVYEFRISCFDSTLNY